MPSPNNITELVIFAIGAIVVIIILQFLVRFTPLGKKISRTNTPQIDYTRPAEISPTRTKHVDPVSGAAVKIWLAGFGVAIVLAFVYYFVTKGGFYVGN